MIEDPRVATSYAIQAILIFDHLHFAAIMNAVKKPTQLLLQKPIPVSKAKASWFARYYGENSQLARDRLLLSH
jgi:hypothetical protein